MKILIASVKRESKRSCKTGITGIVGVAWINAYMISIYPLLAQLHVCL
jgi:hypothetical protein